MNDTMIRDELMQQARLSVDWEIVNQDVHPDPNADIDISNGQCCCGEYRCKEEYVHWTSGW